VRSRHGKDTELRHRIWRSLSAALSSAATGNAAYSNNGTAGYWAGGNEGTGNLNTIDKTTFSDGSLATIVATLNNQVWLIGAASNSGTAGYAYGGYSASWNDINKLTYAADTASVVSMTAGYGRYGTAGSSDSGTAGYFFGGNQATTHARMGNIMKLPYATDVTANMGIWMTTPRAYGASYANCKSL
jgi:hypothetical protein